MACQAIGPQLPAYPGRHLSLQVVTALFAVVNWSFPVVTGLPDLNVELNATRTLNQSHHQVESPFIGCFSAKPQQPPEVRRPR